MRQQIVNNKKTHDRCFEKNTMPCWADSSIAFLSLSLLQSLRSAKLWIWSSYSYRNMLGEVIRNNVNFEGSLGELTRTSCGTSVFFARWDAEFGLPGDHQTSRRPQPSARVGRRLLIPTPQSLKSLIERSVWATRGWIYQQRTCSCPPAGSHRRTAILRMQATQRL